MKDVDNIWTELFNNGTMDEMIKQLLHCQHLCDRLYAGIPRHELIVDLRTHLGNVHRDLGRLIDRLQAITALGPPNVPKDVWPDVVKDIRTLLKGGKS